MRRLSALIAAPVIVAALAGCGSDAIDPPAAAESSESTPSLVDPATASSILTEAPEDLVVLDVRTPEEFAEGHLDDAVLVDFYDADFADQIADLDPDVPYVVYCRSGNRSSQAAELMRDLGFGDVTDVDGGIVAWNAAGLPIAG